MKCSKCGQENVDGTKFCASCGAELPEAPQENTQQNAYQNNNPYNNLNNGQPQPIYSQPVPPYQPYAVTPQIPDEYKPISMWGYFGYQLLFSIPCVGFILLLVFSFGGTKNINLKNYARSFFCFLILAVIISIIIFIAIGGAAALTASRYYY